MTWVAVLMGSESDWEVMRGCTEVLESLGVDFEVRVTSAHRTPRETAEYVADAISRDCGAFICAAGLAATDHHVRRLGRACLLSVVNF